MLRYQYAITLFFFLPELFLSHDDMEKLHDFEEECAEDYFREKEILLQSSSDKRIQVINERYVNYGKYLPLSLKKWMNLTY